MAHRIRRNSMEHMALYDLDQFNKAVSSTSRRGRPPIPPPRKHRHRPTNQSTFERYQFLCDMQRQKADPVYAATPMFTTIPHSSHYRPRRRLLGSYIPPEIIKPIQRLSSESSESKGAEKTDDQKKEEAKKSDDDADDDDDDNVRGAAADDDDNDRDDIGESSSSSSDDKDNDRNDDILDDNDDDNRGVVEQIFNRDKK